MNAADEIRRLESLADWLDSRFKIPGTSIRFGLDSLLGLVPGIGDVVSFLPAAWLILRAHRLGVPWHLKLVMLGNALIDGLIGAIPLLGDLFDIGFKANRRNVGIIRRHLQRRGDLAEPVT
ncbi:DUF4112 domain-containing protein [Maricaulis sp. CAU 1757]